MDETVDVQAVTIGVGTIAAVGLLGYHTVVSESLFGYETTALATGAFALTFLAVALLHGAYGRGDFALAHGLAGVGLLFVAIASTGPQVLVGMACLVAGGSYIAIKTVRARREQREVRSTG